jgi:hypothetical protein
MVKHVFIPQSGFNIAFDHAKQIDWDHASFYFRLF